MLAAIPATDSPWLVYYASQEPWECLGPPTTTRLGSRLAAVAESAVLALPCRQ